MQMPAPSRQKGAVTPSRTYRCNQSILEKITVLHRDRLSDKRLTWEPYPVFALQVVVKIGRMVHNQSTLRTAEANRQVAGAILGMGCFYMRVSVRPAVSKVFTQAALVDREHVGYSSQAILPQNSQITRGGSKLFSRKQYS
jgi:hypothetical protein